LTNDYRDIKLFIKEVQADAGAAPVPAFFNRLEDTTLRLFPELGRLKREMSGRGLEGVTMTGSGSAFFGIPRGRKEADLIAKQLRDTGLGSVFVAETTG
jgi:4-diphosphocytidyl-2C-methyl-D-erythritol kinase